MDCVDHQTPTRVSIGRWLLDLLGAEADKMAPAPTVRSLSERLLTCGASLRSVRSLSLQLHTVGP
jgi:hypothetical protein